MRPLSAPLMAHIGLPTMTTAPLLPEIHVGTVDPNEPGLSLASADVLRYVWHSRFGDMLLEVRDGQAFVNGQPVVQADRPVAKSGSEDSPQRPRVLGD